MSVTINCILLQVCPDFSCSSWCRKITHQAPGDGQPEYLLFLTRANGIGGRAGRGPQLLSPQGQTRLTDKGCSNSLQLCLCLRLWVSRSVSGSPVVHLSFSHHLFPHLFNSKSSKAAVYWLNLVPCPIGCCLVGHTSPPSSDPSHWPRPAEKAQVVTAICVTPGTGLDWGFSSVLISVQ